jgi:hypothetical protein
MQTNEYVKMVQLGLDQLQKGEGDPVKILLTIEALTRKMKEQTKEEQYAKLV